MNQRNSVVGLVLAIVVGTIFVGVGGYAYQTQREAVQEHKPVNATVVESTVDKHVTTTDGEKTVEYRPVIAYEYTVSGQRYVSENIGPESSVKEYDTRSAAKDFLTDYQPGDRVKAYYDPKNHGQAFLIKDVEHMLLLFIVFGGLAVLLGVGGLIKKILGGIKWVLGLFF